MCVQRASNVKNTSANVDSPVTRKITRKMTCKVTYLRGLEAGQAFVWQVANSSDRDLREFFIGQLQLRLKS